MMEEWSQVFQYHMLMQDLTLEMQMSILSLNFQRRL